MKKLVCLSLAMALGITCYETEAIGRAKAVLAKSVAARAAAGQDVSAADVEGLVNDPAIMSKLSIEEQINNYIAAGNQVCVTGNWNEVLRTPGVTVPIARLMSRVERHSTSTKETVLYPDNFSSQPPQEAGRTDRQHGAISRVFWQERMIAYNQNIETALNTIATSDWSAPDTSIVAKLRNMGALYAVAKGLGIPNAQASAQATTSDAQLIGPMGDNLVVPWTNPDGSGPTDAQKLRAAELYYKIAKTLE